MRGTSVTLALTLLAAGIAGAEERTVQVPGSRSWTTTGIRVYAGDQLEFRAAGDIGWGKGDAGPDGSRNASGGFFRPLNDRPVGGLIGRVGTSVFWIGREAEVKAPADGEIELGVNDDKVSDNSGEFRVDVAELGVELVVLRTLGGGQIVVGHGGVPFRSVSSSISDGWFSVKVGGPRPPQ
jgi:hypothetical protein